MSVDSKFKVMEDNFAAKMKKLDQESSDAMDHFELKVEHFVQKL